MANNLLWNGEGGMQGLLGNPLLAAGLGLLSSSRDNRVDPYQMAMQGLMQSGQYQQQQEQAKMQREMFDLQKAEVQRKADAQTRAAQAKQEVQGLLGSGDVMGAAQVGLMSGDEQLARWASQYIKPVEQITPYQQANLDLNRQKLDLEKTKAGSMNPYQAAQLALQRDQFNAMQPLRDAQIATANAAIDPELQGRLASAKAGAKRDAEIAKENTEKQRAWDQYVAASDGLMSGLAGSATGPIAGRIPAVTTDQQIAEGGVAAMAPVLKSLFRVAGEGTFTDRDQQLLLDMVPKRTDTSEARKAKLANIDSIVRAKLGMAPEPKPANPGAVDDLVKKYAGGG